MHTASEYFMTIKFQPPQGDQLPKFTAEPELLQVDAGVHMILINLVTEGGPPGINAVFAPRAIDWTDKDGFVRVTPPAFALTYSQEQLLLQDQNVAGTHGTFEFIVYVSYLGFTYASPDPTIINKQPTGEITVSLLAKRHGTA